MHDDEDDSEDAEERSGLETDLIASYLKFGSRAVSKRRVLVALVFSSLAAVTIAIAVLWPRTYRCESRLMVATNQVLETRGHDWSEALKGADDVILRRDNLEAIAKQTDLVRLWSERRPFILRLKDSVMDKLRGKLSDRDFLSGLIWTLGNKLTVENTALSLTIAVDWPDAETSSRIVQAAEDNFLEARHVAEISTFSEYISILEGHAATIRTEVDTIATQIQKLREEKVAAVEKKVGATKAVGGAAPVIRRAPIGPRVEVSDEELPRLKAEIEAKKRTIAELEEFRNRRLLESQAKLAELQAKYTELHPAILTEQQNILSLSHESPQTVSLRSELRDLEGALKKSTLAGQAATGSGTGYVAMTATPDGAPAGAAPLPAEIMNLMQETSDDLDPAVAAQLRYAVDKYAALRSQISSARIDLDTAQAAFKHRYKIVLPPEVPEKPVKPKIPLILGGGLVGGLLIALLVAIAAELRSGRIVERWQVQQLELPVLAELRFPPRSSE